MDGKLAVIGLGSIGSMALWQASRLSDSVVGFEAQSPAHARSEAAVEAEAEAFITALTKKDATPDTRTVDSEPPRR